MKKAAILTIHSVNNYGAVLQAYALKQAIEDRYKELVDISIIDYKNEYFQSHKNISFTGSLSEKIIQLERLFFYGFEENVRSSVRKFINVNDSLTTFCSNEKELIDLVKELDIVVSGSDQVWNPSCTGADYNYFLPFDLPLTRKISYASSFGGYKFPIEQEGIIKGFLTDFDFLSCREIEGKEYVESLGLKCDWVCDPTLLLNRETYQQLCVGHIRNKITNWARKKYVLIYLLESNDVIFKKAKEIAKNNNYKVYLIFPNLRHANKVDHTFLDVSVEEFCYLFANAEFVVTNSFHGTCFSIINQKDFFTIKSAGAKNGRITSLLEGLGIADRFAIPEESDDLDYRKQIDYYSVNEKLDTLKRMSFYYLDRAFKAEAMEESV